MTDARHVVGQEQQGFPLFRLSTRGHCGLKAEVLSEERTRPPLSDTFTEQIPTLTITQVAVDYELELHFPGPRRTPASDR